MGIMASASQGTEPRSRALGGVLRAAALAVAGMALAFTLNNFLIFWGGWPGVGNLLADVGWPGAAEPDQPLDGAGVALGSLQLLFYVATVAVAGAFVLLARGRTLTMDATSLAAVAAYIARAAFWGVLLVGVADMVISFLRVEGLLRDIVGESLAKDLGRSSYRGNLIHFPLIAVALVIAYFRRSLGFIWLALLIVLAEFQIVVARFVFSYEQAFMGDLVRFWYAALFLFASAYTLIEEGHVRVDVIYTALSDRAKAWSNVVGSIILGVPLCWVILTSGMWGKSNLINAPLLSYEVTQSGYGMYVKYLMAGFLLVYALSMLMQFLGYALRNAAVLLGDSDARPTGHQGAP